MAPRVQEKKGGLTLEKLASYDDVITDALVDKVRFAERVEGEHDRRHVHDITAN
jgi:hypothetical protein